MQVFVEVAGPRRQGKRLDARSFGTFGQCRERRVTRGIGVARDVEPTQRRREQKSGEVISRERSGHRHGRQRTAQRQHRLDAFADSEDVVARAEADGMAEETAHGPSWRVDWRLAEPSGASQVRCAPVMAPERSVTAAIIAGQVSVGEVSSER